MSNKSVINERDKMLMLLEKSLKNGKTQDYRMGTSKSDARNIITIFIGLFGVLALYSGFQTLQKNMGIFDTNVIISFIIGGIILAFAYYLLRS